MKKLVFYATGDIGKSFKSICVPKIPTDTQHGLKSFIKKPLRIVVTKYSCSFL